MKHEKFKNPTKGSRNKKVNLNKLDYDNLSEEELSNLDDMVDED